MTRPDRASVDRPTVLVVDTDGALADLEAALGRHAPSFAVQWADDADAALVALPTVDAVVAVAGSGSDADLGVLHAVRERTAGLPVVVVFDEPSDESTAEALGAGATDVVAAAAPRSLFATRLENALARGRVHATEPTDSARDGGGDAGLAVGNDGPDEGAANDEDLTALKERALDEANMGIVISAAGGDTEMVFANEGFGRITGYDPETFVGRNCRILQGPDTDERPVRTMREAIAEGRHSSVVLKNYRQDGTPFWNEVDISPVRDDDGTVTHFLGFQRDVTERKRLQQELVAARRSLQRLYAVTTDASLSFEERVERTLAIGCERLGVDLGFVTDISDDTQTVVHAVGDHPLLQPGEACPLSESYCRRTLETDGLLAVVHAADEWHDDPAYEAFGLECYVGGKVTVDGELYGTLCFADDEPRDEPFSESQAVFVELLTRWVGYELERRMHERDLRVAERRFRSLFDNPMTFAGVLDPDGTLREANDTALSTLEPGASVVGTPFWETPWWDVEGAAETVRAAVERAAEGNVAQFDCDYVHANGTGTVGVTIYPVYETSDDGDADDDRETVVSLMTVGTDTTTRTEQAAQIKRQRDRLEEFASVVSHDLRSPLEVARGRLQLYEATGDEAHLDSADDSLDRISTLIDDLLTLARQGDAVSDVEETTVTSVARQAWNTVATADADASLAVELDAETTVAADPSRLQQLFENLFRNSAEHGSTGNRTGEPSGDSVEHGSTGSRAGPDDSAEHGSTDDAGVTIRLTALDGEHGFAVEDDGPGVDPAHRDSVFERGYTTSDDGTGFGLAIVRSIADAHGWSVGLAESDAGGARFEFGFDR